MFDESRVKLEEQVKDAKSSTDGDQIKIAEFNVSSKIYFIKVYCNVWNTLKISSFCFAIITILAWHFRKGFSD